MSIKTKVKIFDTGVNEEQEINQFLEQNNATAVRVDCFNLHDMYSDGRLCSQWIRTILVYSIEEE